MTSPSAGASPESTRRGIALSSRERDPAKRAGDVLPFKGLRVLNFGWYWVCATITHILGDFGAEVIKIESNGRMEVLKSLAPFLGNIEEPDRCMWAHNLSRNNRGVTINLGTPRGRQLVLDLVRESDVVAENWTPGAMKKLGLDYESLRRVRSDLIMISPSAAGQWGPYNQINTYGTVMAALSGLDAINGYEGERPMQFGMAITDPIAGIMGAFAVVAALKHRSETGEGRYIDFSQWEGMATSLGPLFLDYQWNRRVRPPMGSRALDFVPHNVYPCQPAQHASPGPDRWVTIAVYTEQEWQGLCDAIGDPALRTDPRFADKFRRKRNERALDERIAAWTRQRANREATAVLQAHGVAAYPSSSAPEAFTDPQFLARGAWLERQHPLGREVIYGVPWKLSDTPGSVREDCPLVGEDNELVWCDLLGLPQQDFHTLEDQKVIY